MQVRVICTIAVNAFAQVMRLARTNIVMNIVHAPIDASVDAYVQLQYLDMSVAQYDRNVSVLNAILMRCRKLVCGKMAYLAKKKMQIGLSLERCDIDTQTLSYIAENRQLKNLHMAMAGISDVCASTADEFTRLLHNLQRLLCIMHTLLCISCTVWNN
jgi:hypothetical protein